MITVTDIFAGAGGSTTGMAQVDGVIVDLFAGPGGWDEGLRMIGRTDVVGVEWDESACRTAEAAGHKRVRADVSALEPLDFVRGAALCDLLGISVADAIATHRCPSLPIASPPCQAWSFAGKRGGEADRATCHTLADRTAAGTVFVDLLDDARVSIAGGRATLRLRIRDALEVAKAIQRAVFDAESVTIEHDFDTETAPNEAENDTERG